MGYTCIHLQKMEEFQNARKARTVTKHNAYTIDPLDQIIAAEVSAYGHSLANLESNANEPLSDAIPLELNSTTTEDSVQSEDASGILNKTEITRCPCHRQSNRGLMICCEQCHVWQHTDCVGLPDILPSEYYCEQCKPIGHSYFDKLMAIEEGVFELSRHSTRVNSRTNSLSLSREHHQQPPARPRSTINSMEQIEWTPEQIEIMFGDQSKSANHSPSRALDSDIINTPDTKQPAIQRTKRKYTKDKENIPQIDTKESPPQQPQDDSTLDLKEDFYQSEPKVKKPRKDTRKSHKKLPKHAFKSKQESASFGKEDVASQDTNDTMQTDQIEDQCSDGHDIKEEDVYYDERVYGNPPLAPCRPHHNSIKLSINGMMKRVNDITECVDRIEFDAAEPVYSILPTIESLDGTNESNEILERLKSSLLEFLAEYG